MLSSITIRAVAVKSSNCSLQHNISKLSDIRDHLSSLRYSIDSDILARRNIRARMDSANRQLNMLEARMIRMEAFINDSIEKYCMADERVKRKVSELVAMLEKATIGGNLFIDVGKVVDDCTEFLGDVAYKGYSNLAKTAEELWEAGIQGLNDLDGRWSSLQESTPEYLKPFLGKGSLLGLGVGIHTVIKYWKAFADEGFSIVKNGSYAIVKGARSNFAITKEAILGTRYAIKNANKYPNVMKFVDPATAIKDGLNPKTLGGKLGYLGIVLDTGDNLLDNIENDAKHTKIAADAVVDAGFGIGGIAASVATGAAVGSVVPVAGTAVGAAAGLVAGLVYTGITECKIWGGTSIKDASKETVGKFFDWIAN